MHEKPPRTMQASSQTSRTEQHTISTPGQSQQRVSQLELSSAKSDGREINLSSCDASVATNSNILTPPPSPIKYVYFLTLMVQKSSIFVNPNFIIIIFKVCSSCCEMHDGW